MLRNFKPKGPAKFQSCKDFCKQPDLYLAEYWYFLQGEWEVTVKHLTGDKMNILNWENIIDQVRREERREEAINTWIRLQMTELGNSRGAAERGTETREPHDRNWTSLWGGKGFRVRNTKRGGVPQKPHPTVVQIKERRRPHPKAGDWLGRSLSKNCDEVTVAWPWLAAVGVDSLASRALATIELQTDWTLRVRKPRE